MFSTQDCDWPLSCANVFFPNAVEMLSKHLTDHFLKQRSLTCSISNMKHLEAGRGEIVKCLVLPLSADFTNILRSRRGSLRSCRDSTKSSLVRLLNWVAPVRLTSVMLMISSPEFWMLVLVVVEVLTLIITPDQLTLTSH